MLERALEAARAGRAQAEADLCELLAIPSVSSASEHRDDCRRDRKSTRLNSSHSQISYAVFCLKKKKTWRRSSKTCSNVSCILTAFSVSSPTHLHIYGSLSASSKIDMNSPLSPV